MHMGRYFLIPAVFLFPFFALSSEEIIVRTPSGSSITLEIDPHQTFYEVLDSIEMQIQEIEGIIPEMSSPILIDYMQVQAVPCSNRATSTPRNYAEPASAADKADIRFIVTSLATKSWAQLLGQRSSLNKAGDRVDHVHPLRFVQVIFTDDEMNGCLHSIRDRSLVWKKFFSGLAGSLDEESARNNMRPEFIQDFAASLKIDPSLFMGLLQQKRWSDFIDVLLKTIPRSGNPGRYEM